jgi:hypothetical protein
MKPVQKLVLVLFALVDVAVIGGLAMTVVRSSRRQLPEAAPTAVAATGATPSACVAGLLERFSAGGASARVDWNDGAGTATRATVDITLAAGSLPEPPTPQLLWSLLDRLSPALLQECELPPTVTLRVRVTQESGTQLYALETPGDVLAGWLLGDVDDAELAAHARYRESVLPAP